MGFQDKLYRRIKKTKSLVCVGLDSQMERIPPSVKKLFIKDVQFQFNKAIIDSTFALVCAYKPNTAFYEAEGSLGIESLKKTCDYLKEKYPEIPIILDAKRGDIGNSNEGYAEFAYHYLGADAITLSPYLGKEALKTFLDRKDKGAIILCRTSNPGAGEFQDLTIEHKPLYQLVAEKVVREWNYNGNCALVVGATYPPELKIVRHIIGKMLILIPGIGAQGADIEKTIKAGIYDEEPNMIINSSRNIIFASSGEDFAQKAKEETLKLQSEINKFINL